MFILGLASQLGALDPDTPLDNYVKKNWQMKDGLPSNMVNEIIQTADGYIWIGYLELLGARPIFSLNILKN